MAILLFRTLLVYVLIIGAMRLMGKKQLGELQPSELVSTILISNLASISIESPELPLIGSVVPVFIIVATEILLSALCVRSRRAAKLVSGSPRVIIRNGVIDQATLFDLRFTVDDLLEALRGKDVFELSDVAFAIVETNGSVSVLKKFPRDTPCNKDLHGKATVTSFAGGRRAESRQYAALLCGCGLDRRSVPQCGARTEGRAFIFVQRRQRDEYRKKRKPVKTGFPHRF